MRFKNIIAPVVLSAMVFGCTDSRPDQDLQGANLNELRPLSGDSDQTVFGKLSGETGTDCSKESLFQSTDYTINVESVETELENSVSRNIVIEDKMKGFKFLDEVTFTTTDPLLKGRSKSTRMLGTPGEQYAVLRQFTPNHLIINKVVGENQVSHLEKTYSCKMGSTWVVPVGGYSISGYFNVEKVRDTDNRDTNVRTRVEVHRDKFKSAQTYLIDEGVGYQPFERISKTDIFPKSFFDDEWYFSSTVVATRFGDRAATGGLGGTDATLNPTSKVRFFVQDDFLFALNTNVDEDLQGEDNNLNYNVALKIPVVNKDFIRLVDSADFVGLEEQEDDRASKGDANYIEVQFREVETPSSANVFSSVQSILERVFEETNQFKEVMNLRIGDGYFSFLIEDGERRTLTRYAFRKVKEDKSGKDYVARRLYPTDFQKFGAFETQKAQKRDYKIAKRDDIERNRLMARHNPKKDIVYRFSSLTPKDDYYRDIGREVINLWQQAFKKAGLEMNIVLDESEDADLGDIRYNVLNIPGGNQVGLLGFGPSLVDTDTGEIISSSSNTYVGTVFLSQFAVVRNYLGRKSGIYYDFKQSDSTRVAPVLGLFDSINSNLMYTQPEIKKSRNGRIEVQRGPLKPMYGHELVDERGNLDPSKMDERTRKAFEVLEFSTNQKFASLAHEVDGLQGRFGHWFLRSPGSEVGMAEDYNSSDITDAFISEKCPEVDALAERMKTEFVITPEEIQIIEPCVRMLSQADAVETTIHEVGHNLSLRHNFIGSYDKENWVDASDFELKYFNNRKFTELFQPVSSSVMEYTAGQEKNIYPGKYDIAALRWIYGSKVELKDGSIKEVAIDKPIEQSLGSGDSLKEFGFCTDQHTARGVPFGPSPFCVTRDRGTTQLEIVKHSIDRMYKSLISTYRYNNTGVRRGLPPFIDLKFHYDQWRFYVSQFVGTSNPYISGYSAEQYQAVVDQMLADKENGQLYKEALQSRNLIVKAMIDLALMNNKYCIVQDAEGDEFALELAKIRTELTARNIAGVVSSCESDIAAEYIKNVEKMTFIKEVGHFMDAGQFDIDPFAEDWLDFIGLSSTRFEAMTILGIRFSPIRSNFFSGRLLNMMDEPDVRSLVQDLLVDRITNGVRVNTEPFNINIEASDKLLGEEDMRKMTAGPAYINFGEESQMLTQMMGMMFQSLFVPEDSGATGERISPWLTNFAVSLNDFQDEVQDSIRTTNGYYWTRSRDGYINRLFAKYRQVQLETTLARISPAQFNGIKTQIVSLITEELPADGDPMTIGHLFNVVNFANAVEQGQDGDVLISDVISGLFQLERDVFNNVLNALNQNGTDLLQLYGIVNDENASEEDKAAAQAQIDQIEAIPVTDIYVGLLNDPQAVADYGVIVTPTQTGLDLRFDYYLGKVSETVKVVTKNQIELDKQLSLILQAVGEIAL